MAGRIPARMSWDQRVNIARFLNARALTLNPSPGTVEKDQSEAEGTLSIRPKRRQEWVPDASCNDAVTFST
ncbi:MAG: hypothetical protein WBP42_00365, partial [Candidatus Zixiibacteriota bacterium]